jgi:hypothetical protein
MFLEETYCTYLITRRQLMVLIGEEVHCHSLSESGKNYPKLKVPDVARM